MLRRLLNILTDIGLSLTLMSRDSYQVVFKSDSGRETVFCGCERECVRERERGENVRDRARVRKRE